MSEYDQSDLFGATQPDLFGAEPAQPQNYRADPDRVRARLEDFEGELDRLEAA